MTDLSSLTADHLAETVAKAWGGKAIAPGYVEAAASLAELVRRLKTAEDALGEISACALDPVQVGDSFVHAIGIADRALAAIRPNPDVEWRGSGEQYPAIRPNPKP